MNLFPDSIKDLATHKRHSNRVRPRLNSKLMKTQSYLSNREDSKSIKETQDDMRFRISYTPHSESLDEAALKCRPRKRKMKTSKK